MKLRRWILVAIVPVAVGACGRAAGPPEGEPSGPLPDVAGVVCDAEGTTVMTPEVRPQPDGVHVVVDNRTDRDLGIAFRSGFEAGGDNADRGTSNHVWLAPPGPVAVGCEGPEGQPDLEGGPSFTVRDPEGLWVSPQLECRSGGVGAGTDGYGRPPKGDPRDPVAIAEERFAPLEPGDRVEPAGYPEAERRLVVLIRDGRAVALVEYVDASFAGGEAGSGWIEDQYSACDEAAG